ncbi:MAG: DUF6152 family protein [Gammaproteobacteria bacterium]
MNTSIAIKFTALGTLLASSVLAHHSTAVNFNRNSEISVEGVIIEYRFQNPHVQILLDVTNDDGEVERWMVEMSAKNQLLRSGWKGDEFVVGTRITVFGSEGYRPRSMLLRRAIMPDGTELRPGPILVQ